ncbi:MAG: sugar ABC transporter substrate-binding protein [Anaerolineae bacterium]|nr:sugar ABC transporter substrate-binding protein [Anaerolineae bacterium]
MKRYALTTVLLTILLLALTGVSQAQEQPAEITYMMWGSPEELAVWQTIVDEFQAAHPDIHVTVDVSDWTSYWDKLQTLFAGGAPPDVFAMDAPLYLDWQSRGVLLNLQPYIDATPGFLDGFYPVTLEVYKQDDGYYGLPRDFQTIVLYYNKDMFDTAGIDYPTDDWTLDDLRTAAKALTVDSNGDGITDQWGFGTDLWDMELFWSEAIWGFGGSIISDDHMQTLINEGSAHDAWNFISSMMLEDKSIPDPNQAAQFGGDPFAAGVAAMTTIGHWVVPQYAGLGFSWDVAAFPAGPAGRATSVNSAGFVIANGSQHPDQAWELVKYALSSAGQSRLTELGFAIPVLQSLAESPVFLEQNTAPIRQQVFLDALEYAHVKPVFRGYDEWASVVGDGLLPVWTGDISLDDAMAEVIPAADDVLASNVE